MKKLAFLMMLCGGFLLISGTAMAIPLLQLDADPGTHDGNTTITTATNITVSALLNANSPKYGDPFDVGSTDVYYLLMTWDNDTGDTFDITPSGGSTTQVTLANTGYLIPDPNLNHGELLQYGQALEFDFYSPTIITPYNVQTGSTQPGIMYSQAFAVDFTDFDSFPIHFDFYAWDGQERGDFEFAPYSKDVTATPEPATILLLGVGLIGVAAFGRRKLKRRHS